MADILVTCSSASLVDRKIFQDHRKTRWHYGPNSPGKSKEQRFLTPAVKNRAVWLSSLTVSFTVLLIDTTPHSSFCERVSSVSMFSFWRRPNGELDILVTAPGTWSLLLCLLSWRKIWLCDSLRRAVGLGVFFWDLSFRWFMEKKCEICKFKNDTLCLKSCFILGYFKCVMFVLWLIYQEMYRTILWSYIAISTAWTCSIIY